MYVHTTLDIHIITYLVLKHHENVGPGLHNNNKNI